MARTVCIHYSSTDEYSINTRVRLGPSINLMQCILYLLRDGVTAETDANKPPQIADFNIIYCVHNIITILHIIPSILQARVIRFYVLYTVLKSCHLIGIYSVILKTKIQVRQMCWLINIDRVKLG